MIVFENRSVALMFNEWQTREGLKLVEPVSAQILKKRPWHNMSSDLSKLCVKVVEHTPALGVSWCTGDCAGESGQEPSAFAPCVAKVALCATRDLSACCPCASDERNSSVLFALFVGLAQQVCVET